MFFETWLNKQLGITKSIFINEALFKLFYFLKKKIHSTLYNLTVIMVTMIDIVQQWCKERGILLS